MISNLAKNSLDKEYEDVLEGYFSVSNIQEGVLWLDEELGDRVNIGPVFVTKQISELCQHNWNINLVIGRDKKGWHILESGTVYR